MGFRLPDPLTRILPILSLETRATRSSRVRPRHCFLKKSSITGFLHIFKENRENNTRKQHKYFKGPINAKYNYSLDDDL